MCYPFSSGTEEEYGELSQLLEDISSYLRDIRTIQATQAEERAAQLKKCEMEKRKAEEMRYAAMERMLSKFHAWFIIVNALLCLVRFCCREETFNNNFTHIIRIHYPYDRLGR